MVMISKLMNFSMVFRLFFFIHDLKILKQVPSAKEEVRPEYEEYLLLLQQRNR